MCRCKKNIIQLKQQAVLCMNECKIMYKCRKNVEICAKKDLCNLGFFAKFVCSK
jgi:hypothetical protein